MIHPSMSAYADTPLWACTTLNRLKEAQACPEGYHKFAQYLKEQWPAVGADDPVPLLLALNSNSFEDVLWALCCAACAPADRQLRELACDFAERALSIFEKHFPEDKRPREALLVSRSFARGEASGLALEEAWRFASAADAVAAAYVAAAAAAYAADAADAAATYQTERDWQRKHLARFLQGNL